MVGASDDLEGDRDGPAKSRYIGGRGGTFRTSTWETHHSIPPPVHDLRRGMSNYQIEISNNCDVVRGNPAPETNDRGHLYSNAAIRFHVQPKKLTQFRSELDAVRPVGDLALDASCKQAHLPDGSPDPLSTPSSDDIEVRWVEAGRSDRLTACADNRLLRGKVQDALRSLGVDPYSGKPLKP